jgi:hypothetical protein
VQGRGGSVAPAEYSHTHELPSFIFTATIPRSRDRRPPSRDDASTRSPLRKGSMASSQRVFVATSLKEGVVITLPASSNVGDLAGVCRYVGPMRAPCCCAALPATHTRRLLDTSATSRDFTSRSSCFRSRNWHHAVAPELTPSQPVHRACPSQDGREAHEVGHP